MKKILICLALIICAFSTSEAQDAKAKGKFGGVVFMDYFYNVARDSNITNLPNSTDTKAVDLNGFNVGRVFFTYDYDFSETFTSRFRIEADGSALSSNGNFGVFVKDAYITWNNIFEGSNLTFGLQPTFAYEASETVWGHRFLEKTQMDLRGYVSSRDFGLTLKGKIDSEGMVKYSLMYGNDAGVKPETDKYKRYYANLQFSPNKNLLASVYADLRTRKSIKDLDGKTDISNNDLTAAVFAGYQEKDQYLFGAEAFMNMRSNHRKTDTEFLDRNGMGVSGFGTLYFNPNLSVTARYDYFEPDMHADVKEDTRQFMLLALNFITSEKITISPNVYMEMFEKTTARDIDPSMTARLTLYYKY